MGLNRNLGQLTEVIKESGGFIGIGTPSPGALLSLSAATGTSSNIFRLANSSGANASNIVRQEFYVGNSFGGLESIASITALNPNASANNGGALYFSTSANGTGTTPTERMRILSSGNVGINDTNPSNRLTVVGASLANVIKWTDNINNTGYLGIRNIGVSIGSDDDIIFENGGATKMRLYKSGNLYIGTSPVDSVKLKVEDSGANSIMSLGTTTTTGRTTIDLLTNGYDWEIGARGSANSPNNSFYIYNIDTSSYRFIISPTGNIGIGMTPNLSKMTVGGIVTIGEFTNGTAWINAEGGAAYFGNGGKTTSLWIYNNGNYLFTGSNVSDARAKENINNLEFNATEKIMALQPKSYYMKSDLSQIRYGFIAQEVDEILPDLTNGDAEGEDFIGLDYNGIIPVLTKAIQEQQEIIKQLTNRIINLENK